MDFEKFTENVQEDLSKTLSGAFPNVSVELTRVSKLQGQYWRNLWRTGFHSNITNQMLEHYGITEDQLHQDDPQSPMWVATNESWFNGAAVIAYPMLKTKTIHLLHRTIISLSERMKKIIVKIIDTAAA